MCSRAAAGDNTGDPFVQRGGVKRGDAARRIAHGVNPAKIEVQVRGCLKPVDHRRDVRRAVADQGAAQQQAVIGSVDAGVTPQKILVDSARGE